jgi:hypothetical protein
MNRQRLLIAALSLFCLLLVGGYVAYWFLTHQKVTFERELPPTGEAAFNPLYPLKRALEIDERKVDARRELQLARTTLAPNDTLVMFTDTRILSAGERKRLLDWVRSGGHLVLPTPPQFAEIDSDALPLFDALGVQVEGDDADSRCAQFKIEDQKQHVEFCNGRRFALTENSPDPSLYWFDEEWENYVYARLPLGKGSVDVAAQLDVMQRSGLDEHTHAALTRQLLAPNYDKGGTFHLVYSAEMPNIFELLLRNAWMLLLPLALAIPVWLWMRTQRLGPLLPSAPDHRRSLLEHIQASGDHLYRYGRAGLLYGEAREAFLRRLRRRDPYTAALDGPGQIEAIARRTGLSRAEVEESLRLPRHGDRRDFVLRIAKLLQLRHRL